VKAVKPRFRDSLRRRSSGAVVPHDDLGDHILQTRVAEARNDQDDILKSAPIEDNCRYPRTFHHRSKKFGPNQELGSRRRCEILGRWPEMRISWIIEVEDTDDW
jgi:hypothetical protein